VPAAASATAVNAMPIRRENSSAPFCCWCF